MRLSKYIILLLLSIVVVPTASAQSDRQFIRNGNRLYRQQKYDKAEIEYRKALNKNPNNTQALYNLGCALLQQQKDSAAVKALQEAGRTETSPRRKAMAYHNIGVILQQHQQFADAIEAYKESLRNNPSDNETRYNLALCQRQLKNQKNQGGGGGNGRKKQNQNKDKQKDKNNQNKNKNNQDKQNQNQPKQQPQPNEQMSKDNAQQLLNYAEQEEKATQQRIKQSNASRQTRQLQKNW